VTGILIAAVEEPHTSLTPQTRIIAAGIAILFMAVILEFVRRHRLQERYTVIWLLAGLGMLAGAAFPGLLTLLADAMGVRDTNVALFSILILLLLGLAFQFSLIVSRQSEQITRLAQERALERAREGAPGQAPSRPEDRAAEPASATPGPGSASRGRE
jgi:hypothetical protein